MQLDNVLQATVPIHDVQDELSCAIDFRAFLTGSRVNAIAGLREAEATIDRGCFPLMADIASPANWAFPIPEDVLIDGYCYAVVSEGGEYASDRR